MQAVSLRFKGPSLASLPPYLFPTTSRALFPRLSYRIA